MVFLLIGKKVKKELKKVLTKIINHFFETQL